MVVQVKPSSHQCSKTIEGSQQKAHILLLGAESVRKSALTVRFITRRFIGEYGEIESIYSHIDNIDGREIYVNIWDSLYPQDSAITESISEKQLQWADGVILVYSICDRSSFEVVVQQVQRIRHVSRKMSPTAPTIIVGNKRDLQNLRSVPSEEGRLLALSEDCVFFEISAAETYHGVLLVFHVLIDLIEESSAERRGVFYKYSEKHVSCIRKETCRVIYHRIGNIIRNVIWVARTPLANADLKGQVRNIVYDRLF